MAHAPARTRRPDAARVGRDRARLRRRSGIVLDRSAFYPGGGGQPPDHGVLLWGGVQTRIVGARKGDDLYLIPAEGDPLPPAGTRGARRGRGRPADRADAHPLRPARAVRRGVPRLRRAGDRRQHGAAARRGWTSTCPRCRAGFKDAVARPASTPRSQADRRDRRHGCCRGTRRSRCPTSSGPRPTCCRRRQGGADRRHRRARHAGRRRDARRLDPRRSAGSRSSRSRARARGSAACVSASRSRARQSRAGAFNKWLAAGGSGRSCPAYQGPYGPELLLLPRNSRTLGRTSVR